MNVDALRYFLAVVDAGSMRGAADNLHIAQSALSRQIAALELELGTSLLVRLPRGVKPTDAGAILVRRARGSLDQLASASEEIGALRGLTSGRVSLSAIEPVADSLLPACMERLQREHPGISFDIRVGNSRQVVALLREGVVELAVAYNVPVDRDLVVRAETPMPLVALMRRGHPLEDVQTCKLKELARWPLVLPPRASPTRFLIEEAARREACHFERVALECDSVGLRLAFLENSDAVAILAKISGQMGGASRALTEVAIANPILKSGALQLLANRGHQLSHAGAEFERHLRSGMRARK